MGMYLSQGKSAKYLNVSTNTFTKYIREKYPPDRIIGNRFEWRVETLEQIKNDQRAFTKET